MTPRHAILAAGLAFAAWLSLFADKTPTAGISHPTARSSSEVPQSPKSALTNGSVVTQGSARSADSSRNDVAILALLPREAPRAEPAAGAEAAKQSAGKGGAGGLFVYQNWTPPPPPPPPPSAPSAPPLPFSYLGKKFQDRVWEAYLARADNTYIVREQTVIDGTYRVDSIRPPILSLTYLPLNQVQTIFIGVAE